jgi:hypothetical protein
LFIFKYLIFLVFICKKNINRIKNKFISMVLLPCCLLNLQVLGVIPRALCGKALPRPP